MSYDLYTYWMIDNYISNDYVFNYISNNCISNDYIFNNHTFNLNHIFYLQGYIIDWFRWFSNFLALEGNSVPSIGFVLIFMIVYCMFLYCKL